jgi:hypothetical protein
MQLNVVTRIYNHFLDGGNQVAKSVYASSIPRNKDLYFQDNNESLKYI